VSRRAVVAVVAGALAAFAGCQILAGIEDRSHDAPFDATVEAAPPAAEAGVDGGASCDPLVPPLRPGPTAAEPRLELAFAVDSIVLDAPDAGYDLDNACTCKDGPGDPGSCVSQSPRCDGPRGLDNALAAVIQSALGGSFATENTNNRIKSGEIDVLLRLGDYNGSENDDAVVVALFASNGTAGATPEADAGPPPRFDGTDTWTVDPESLLEVDAGADGGIAKFATSDAYVRSSSFVARSSIAYLGLGDLVLRIAGATVTGDIDLAAHPYRIHRGRISGRIGANELLSSLSHINLGSISLCPGGPGATGLYERARSTVCAARDIASDPSRDGKGEPCDAVSVGIGFTAVEAKLGPVRARQFDPLGCDAGPEAYRCP